MNAKGNALFLILIAVALFAALSYAITTSGRGGGNIDREQAAITAAQITQYGSIMERGVIRMKVLNGCADTQISFWHDSNNDNVEDSSDNYYNSLSPDDHSCHLFDQNGGGVNFRPASDFGAAYFIFPNDVCVSGIGNGYYPACASDGTGSTDLLFGLAEINESVCQAIVDNLDDGTIYTDHGNSWLPTAYFTGIFDEGFSISRVGGGNPFTLNRSGCVLAESAPVGRYNYYHILLAR